jgi:LPXTG-site transpeptidase (sortase) family protein
MKIILRPHTLKSISKWSQRFFLMVFTLATIYCALYWGTAVRFQRAALEPPATPKAWHASIEIPRLGLAVSILEGVTPDVLHLAVGHIPGTAWPGQSGNIGLSAHRDTFFRPLRNIRVGDSITLSTTAAIHRYQVTGTRIVPPNDVSVLASTGEEILTLVTCHPFYYVGPAPNRFIVRARLQSVVAPESEIKSLRNNLLLSSIHSKLPRP